MHVWHSQWKQFFQEPSGEPSLSIRPSVKGNMLVRRWEMGSSLFIYHMRGKGLHDKTRSSRSNHPYCLSHLASRWKPWPPAGCFSSPRCKGKGRREQPYWCCSQQHRAVKPHHHTQPGNGPHGPAIPLPERAKINNKNLNQKYHFHDESLL